ncbi:hypothetical protein SAMN05444166_8146 [Singulisphaera sp. GP187]|nr:hypothetical protein SAMN05444166_8146 [Singulisphaera sp. GP187]
MHHRIDTIVKQIRQDIALHLAPESILSACRSVGHTWRRCVLTPPAILHWFVIQVIHGNTALTHISLFGGRSFTATAYCQVRRFLGEQRQPCRNRSKRGRAAWGRSGPVPARNTGGLFRFRGRTAGRWTISVAADHARHTGHIRGVTPHSRIRRW